MYNWITCFGFVLTMTAANVVAETYRSEVDDLVTIKKMAVLPVLDNVQGIYSRPLQSALVEKVQQSHRWDYVDANGIGPILSPEELEQQPDKLVELSSSIAADGFLSLRLSRGPSGVNILLDLFLTHDKKLFAKAEAKDFKNTDIESLKEEINVLYAQLLKHIPYSGRVLSRQNQRITINLGSLDGLEKDQVLSIVQIVSVNRHPKFNFIISSEKEILGRVKVIKVDETLSFGVILNEREHGAIQKDAKVGPLDFVTYPGAENLSPEEPQPDNNAIYGKNPTAWVPKPGPMYGMVGGRFGLGTDGLNTRLNSEGGLDSVNKIYPSVFLEAELWVTSAFSVHGGIRQGILSFSNPLSGSSPGHLSASQSAYDFLFGYNFRFGSDIWGPKIEALIGYSDNRFYIDDSTPTAFTTVEYSGLKFGVDGSSPVTTNRLWGAGGQLYFWLVPHLSESPVTSGSSATSTINQFAAYGYRKLGENLKLLLRLDFELYSTNFSGSGTRTDSATSSSQRITTLSGGIYFLF